MFLSLEMGVACPLRITCCSSRVQHQHRKVLSSAMYNALVLHTEFLARELLWLGEGIDREVRT